MAVKQIYPTNIYLKQLDIGDEKLTIIENYLRAQHLAFTSSLDNDHSEYTDGNENIVIDAIIEGECPEMAELIEEIKKGFLSLAYSNIDNVVPDMNDNNIIGEQTTETIPNPNSLENTITNLIHEYINDSTTEEEDLQRAIELSLNDIS